MLRSISNNKKYSHRCLVGDFNFKYINWKLWNTPLGEASDEAKFLSTLQDSFMHQHVLEPTRRRGNDTPSTLDLVITDEATQISDIAYDSPLGKSDHSTLFFNFNCYMDKPRSSILYNYQKGDYEAMINDIRTTNWQNDVDSLVKSGASTESLWSEIKGKLHYWEINSFQNTMLAINRIGLKKDQYHLS